MNIPLQFFKTPKRTTHLERHPLVQKCFSDEIVSMKSTVMQIDASSISLSTLVVGGTKQMARALAIVCALAKHLIPNLYLAFY